MANTDTKLGIVAILPVGAWVSASTYEYLNLVTNGGGAYLAKQNVPSGTALSNTSYWMQITEKGLKGDKGDKGDTGAKGDTGNGIASVSVEEVSVSGAEHNYRMTVTMTDGTVTTYDYTVTDGAVTSVNGRTGEVIGLAEEDGYYELMSVGSADQLISTQYDEDSVPYKFRTSGGSADIGDREIDEIVGGTLNWNQLNDNARDSQTVNDVTFTKNADGSWTINGTASASESKVFSGTISLGAGHVYFVKGCPSGGGVNTYSFGIGGLRLDTGNGTVWKNTNNYANGNASFVFKSGATFSNVKIYPQIINLTAMFGVEIADYIYNLEQSTEGAGVAWFKKLFPNDYYPYSAPTLTHVSGLSSHDMVGFNQWDEEWELGYYNAEGSPSSSTTNIRSKNYIPVVGGETYYFKKPSGVALYFCLYDEDKNFIGARTAVLNVLSVKLRDDARYMRFNMAGDYGTTYNHDICINLSWSGTRNGEYEPYVKHSYPLDSSLTLRGIPKLDADGNLSYDGDVYSSDGTVQRRYGTYTFTGLETWTASATPNRFSINLTSLGVLVAPQTQVTNALQNIVSSKYGRLVYQNADKVAYVFAGGGNTVNLVINDTAYSTTAEIANAFKDTVLVYELATPTTESATPYTNPQIVNDWGTEEYVSETIVPVGHNTKYTANLRDKLQHLPDLADSDGYYVVQQTGTDMSLIRFRIPQAPTSDGTYTLQATVSGGTPTYTWVADTAESTEVQA